MTAASAVTRRALREVPYYREQCADAGVMISPPALPTDQLDAVAHRLFPLGDRPSDTPWQPQPHELYEALLLTEAYTPASTVFELRPALLDWPGLRPPRRRPIFGRRGAGRYRVILSADAIIDPHGPDAAELLRHAIADYLATPRRTLLGVPADVDAFRRAVAEVDPAAELGATVQIRSVAQAGAPIAGPAVLRDPYLGCIGGWSNTCGRLHVNTRRFAVSDGPDGVEVTKLTQRRPTLVRIRPAGAEGLRLGSCVTHDTPVLLPAE